MKVKKFKGCLKSIRPQKAKKVQEPMQICEIPDIVTATSPIYLAKYYTLIKISHNMRFIYYSNVKRAGTLQFDMFKLCKA